MISPWYTQCIVLGNMPQLSGHERRRVGQSLSNLGQGINLSILQRPMHQTLSSELEYRIGKG